MKKKNIIAVLVAVVVIIAAVLLVSRYLKARTPILLQGTTECTTYKASSKIAGRIVDMKVEEGQRVERGELLYTLSTPELDAKLQQAEAVRSAASAIDQKVLSGARVQQIEAALNMWQQAQAGLQCMAVTEHLLRRGRIDAEHAVHGGAHGGGVGMAGIGDTAYLLQGLGNAGQGQDAVVDSETHAAITSKGEGVARRRGSSGSSVAAITAPPRHTSPSYSTSD